DVFDSPHRDSRQVHLDQCFFDRGLPPLVPLNDRRFKREPPQLRNPQRYLAGLRLELALVVPGPAVRTFRGSLVSLGPADMIRLSVQQPVQCLLNARADDLIHMIPQLPFVNSQRSIAAGVSLFIGGGLIYGLVVAVW